MPSTLRLFRPTRSVLEQALAEAEGRGLSYHPVGMSAGSAPAGYRSLEASVVIGSGDDVFRRAVDALRDWRMFAIPWVALYPDRPALRTGLTVVVAARTGGLWTLNPARIVSMVEDDGRVGFAYGTVEGHAVAGEERFTVSRDAQGVVRYDITARSRLRHPLARLAGPIALRAQRRFAQASLQAMQRHAGA